MGLLYPSYYRYSAFFSLKNFVICWVCGQHQLRYVFSYHSDNDGMIKIYYCCYDNDGERKGVVDLIKQKVLI